MKDIIKIFHLIMSRKIFLSAFLVSVMVSCNSDSPDSPGASDSGENMCVYITLSGQRATETRAPGEDSEDVFGEWGSPAENYINVDDLYIMSFSIPEDKSVLDDDSKLLEILWPIDQAGRETNRSMISSNGENIYLRTELSSSISDYSEGNFCIVAIANMGSFPQTSESHTIISEGMTFGTLWSTALYDYKDGSGILPGEWSWEPDNTQKSGIPMFGVKRVNLRNYDRKIFNESNPFPLISNGNSTLWMLRAFAKVSISLADELKDLKYKGQRAELKIVSASFGNQYEGNFHLIPSLEKMDRFQATGGTGQVTGIPFLDDCSVAGTENNLLFKLYDSQNNAVAYLPEYKLDPYTTVNLELGWFSKEDATLLDRKKYTFNFVPDSEKNNPDDYWKHILRNHIYSYQVHLDFNNVEISLVIKPSGWGNAYDNEFEFGSPAE